MSELIKMNASDMEFVVPRSRYKGGYHGLQVRMFDSGTGQITIGKSYLQEIMEFKTPPKFSRIIFYKEDVVLIHFTDNASPDPAMFKWKDLKTNIRYGNMWLCKNVMLKFPENDDPNVLGCDLVEFGIYNQQKFYRLITKRDET